MLLAGLAIPRAQAQDAGGYLYSAPQRYDAKELDQLVGPIALYVDDLVAIVLPAAAYPLQVVEAARFLVRRQADTSQAPDDDWDDAVIALLNYPEVLRMMDENLRWTARLGEAFVNQPEDVMEAIQRFRRVAKSRGKLQSDPYQQVAEEGDAISIAPADPTVVFVPYYDPDSVRLSYSASSMTYYPYGYPLYYYPYPPGYAFGADTFWSVPSIYHIGWGTHYIYVYGPGRGGHPSHGHHGDDSHHGRGTHDDGRDDHDRHVWQPRDRRGGGPLRRQDGDGQPDVRSGQGALTASTPGDARNSPAGAALAAGHQRDADLYRASRRASGVSPVMTTGDAGARSAATRRSAAPVATPPTASRTAPVAALPSTQVARPAISPTPPRPASPPPARARDVSPTPKEGRARAIP